MGKAKVELGTVEHGLSEGGAWVELGWSMGRARVVHGSSRGGARNGGA